MSLTITQTTLPGVLVAGTYSQTLTATGGTGSLTWSVLSGNLPAWLTLNASSGLISGTAATPGNYLFTVQVTDSSSPPLSATQTFTIPVGQEQISSIASWVTGDYLNRSDITVQAQNAALLVYRIVCAKIPFDELVQLSSELPLTQNQDTYDLSTMVPPLVGITDIRLTISSSQRRRLRRTSGRLYDSLSLITAGYPATYARTAGKQIQINPPPNASGYTLRVRYWTRPQEEATPANTYIVTPLEWNALLRWETAWWVLNELGQEQRASTLVQPKMIPSQAKPRKEAMQEIGIIPRLWNELLLTMSERENVDEDFSINPIMRAYSFRGGR